MSLSEKIFPIRMDNHTFNRLQKQAVQSCMNVTTYIRNAMMERLIKDETKANKMASTKEN